MNRGTSLYLDLVRFTAAMVVFFGHLANPVFDGGFMSFVSPWIDEAVIVFFVLSGFVIAHATQDPRTTPTSYAVARLSRIYSVALPAIAVTIVMDALGRSIDPAHYLNDPGYHADNLVLQFTLAAFFLSQLWYLDMPVGSMGPYWSLCFEVWYYVAFGLLHFLPSPRRWIAIGLLALFVGPGIVAYGLFWAMGVLAYRVTQRPMGGLQGTVLCLGGAGLMAAATSLGVPGEDAVQRLMAPVLGNANYWHDGGVAIGFALHLIGFSAIAHLAVPALAAIETPLRWLAGATFSIYLYHLPVAHVVRVASPFPADSIAGRILLLGGTFLIVLALASVTERRKRDWQRLFAALLGWGAARFRPAGAVATPPR